MRIASTFGIAFTGLFALVSSVLSQSPPANASIEETLRTHFKESPKGADGIPIALEDGTALVVRKAGITSIPLGQTVIPAATYKDGVLHAPGFMLRALTGAQPTRPLPVGEIVYLVNTQINIKADNFTLVVFECDACNGLYYRAAVTFQFEKGALRTAEAGQRALRAIDEVFSADTRANEAQANFSAQPAPNVKPVMALGSLYVSAQNNADRLQLSLDGSFSLQEAGQSFTGSYSVTGATLRLHIVQLQKDVDIAIDGNRLIVNGEETWVQPNQ